MGWDKLSLTITGRPVRGSGSPLSTVVTEQKRKESYSYRTGAGTGAIPLRLSRRPDRAHHHTELDTHRRCHLGIRQPVWKTSTGHKEPDSNGKEVL